MLSLNDFLGSEQPDAVRNAAQQLATYKSELDSNQISKDQYDDLCRDVTALDQIDNLSSDVDERQAIQTAFEIMIQIASVAASF